LLADEFSKGADGSPKLSFLTFLIFTKEDDDDSQVFAIGECCGCSGCHDRQQCRRPGAGLLRAQVPEGQMLQGTTLPSEPSLLPADQLLRTGRDVLRPGTDVLCPGAILLHPGDQWRHSSAAPANNTGSGPSRLTATTG
jgi:hypothetical protein